MPNYIYIHPDTQEEIQIFHSMSEVKNPSPDLLKRITLADGRVMERKIVAPALLGFDNLGRSVKKNGESNGEAKSNGEPKAKSESKPSKKENKVATPA